MRSILKMSRRIYALAAAVSVAAVLAVPPGPARAALVFNPTTFGGFSAVIDQTSGLGWVSPNIAAGDTWDVLNASCHPAWTGALTGLTWATIAQVQQFWLDIGIPLNSFGSIFCDWLGGPIIALFDQRARTDPYSYRSYW